MKNLSVFLYEWKHFTRSPFKIVALVLFIVASVYGLHNGANLYKKQKAEIEKIEEKIKEDRQKLITEHYQEGKLTHKDRPWIDYGTPFWAIWYSSTYHFKNPSPAMVYSIGQAEQYGFYKRVTFWSSPYDADLAEEIANPERLQTSTLDFAFVLLFLSPLVLLVLLYNIKSAETERGFMPLIEVQSTSTNTWLFSRLAFYVILFLLTVVALMLYGGTLTNVFEQASNALAEMFLYAFIYVAFWSVFYFFILQRSKSILINTLQMIGLYLLFAFIIPATVHQSLSISHQANLMTDFIDVREKQEALFEQPEDTFQTKLNELFPEIVNSPAYKDSTKRTLAMNQSASALVNELKKESLQAIINENEAKNTFIKNTFWFNPISFFQNKLNSIAQTHYDDYQNYRNEIQLSIDKQVKVMVLDTWNEVKVDEKKYVEYTTKIN